MKQASINCPHCGESIIVRDATPREKAAAEKAEKIFEEVETLFCDVRKGFKRIFHPSLWKRL